MIDRWKSGLFGWQIWIAYYTLYVNIKRKNLKKFLASLAANFSIKPAHTIVFHCSTNCFIFRVWVPVYPGKDHSSLDKQDQNDHNSTPEILEGSLKDLSWFIWESWQSETKTDMRGAKENDQNLSTRADKRIAFLYYILSLRDVFTWLDIAFNISQSLLYPKVIGLKTSI